MISTITNYSGNIDTLYPISGQDNNSQGFRDNFANIRQALNIAANEINTLNLNLSPVVNKTVVLQNSLGPIQGTTLALSSATISLGQNEVDPSRSQPVLNIAGVKGISLNDGSVSQVKIVNLQPSGTWPYSSAFAVDKPNLVTIGATFQFFENDTTYTILDVNSTTVYLNGQFDPVYLYSKGVNTGTTLTLNNGKLAGSVFQTRNIPASPVGNVGDQKGAISISTNSVHVCTANFDGTTNIWQPLNTNIENNVLGILKASSSTISTYQIGNTVFTCTYGVYTCDLSQYTRFHIPSPGNDTGAFLNFINIPPSPCQIETSVTISVLETTSQLFSATSVPKIFVNGGIPLSSIDRGLGSVSGAAWQLATPSTGGYYKHRITILSETPGSYTAFLTTNVF